MKWRWGEGGGGKKLNVEALYLGLEDLKQSKSREREEEID